MRLFFVAVVLGLIGVLAACATPTPQGGVVPPPQPTIKPPAAVVVTATPEPPGAPQATTAAASANQETPPAETAVPVAPVPADSKLVGSYSGILPAADAIARIVTLDLALDGTASMVTQFIGKGGPSTEIGTWVEDGANAVVTFTQVDGKPEDNRITWTLDGDKLTTTEYDKTQYGSEGLPLTRVGSGNIISTNFMGVSFSFDSTLAQSAQGSLLMEKPVKNEPALGGGAPMGIQFIFDNAKLPDYFDPRIPQVYVYPVDGLKKLDPSVAKGVESLQQLLETKPENPTGDIFVFPLIPAAQGMRTQVRYLDFVEGEGIRFVTYPTQDISAVTNDRIFYTFQGLTLDGKWYVSAFWPVSTPALPDAKDAPDTSKYDAKQFEAYLATVVSTLNSLPPAGFEPNLSLLDNMVQSISASPLFPTPTPLPEPTETPKP